MATSFRILSPAFESDAPIPSRYTCDGENVSPELRWSGAPEGTKSFALVMDDPDAPRKTFVHWVVYNIPADRDFLPADIDISSAFSGAGPAPAEGANDFGRSGYGGPCPPADNEHQYVFRLYALDTIIDLAAGATKSQLTGRIEGHILDEANYYGRYRRARR